MIGLIVALFFAAWFFQSAKKVGKNPWRWAIIGLLSYGLPVFLVGLVSGIAIPALQVQVDSKEQAIAFALGIGMTGIAVGAASATIARASFLREPSSWSFRTASQALNASRSLGTSHISAVLFLALLASGLLRFLWSVAAPHLFEAAGHSLEFEALWYLTILAAIVVSTTGATLILGTIRSWFLIPLAWAALAAGLYALKQYGLSLLLTDQQQRMMAEHSLNWVISLSVFVGAFLPLFLVSLGIRFWGGRVWVFLLGMVMGTTLVHIPVMIQLKASGILRWDLILSPLVEGLLWGGGLYLGLLATVSPSGDRATAIQPGIGTTLGTEETSHSKRLLEEASSKDESGQVERLPIPLSLEEQRAKERAVTDQRIISACGFAGAATFFILNFTTGVVPGGFIGGAIGGGLGGAIGVLISALRPK